MNPKLIKAYAAKMGDTPAEAEAEIVRVMQTVARGLSPAFKFGYHSRADIEQQGMLFALEALNGEAYDVTRPLASFLYTHVRNRLANFKRNHYIRAERPCKCCDPADPPLSPCDKYLAWMARNANKQNLMRPVDVYSVSDEGEANMRLESTVVDDAALSEVLELIDKELPLELRGDYLKMRGGVTIPKNRREKVQEAVKGIIGYGKEDDDD